MRLEPFDSDLARAARLPVRRVRVSAAFKEIPMKEAAVMARLQKQGPVASAELARSKCMKPQSIRTAIASDVQETLFAAGQIIKKLAVN